MMRCLQRLRPLRTRGRRGAAGLEFGLLAPALLLMLAAMTDMGRAVGQSMQLSNALRSAAQFALSYSDDSAAMRAHITSALGGTTEVIVDATCQCGTGTASAAACGTTCYQERLIVLKATRPFSAILIKTITQVNANVTLRSQ
jgi:Flp pilus assembly protein TadG